MNNKCPGQFGRQIIAEELTCPVCRYKVEIFSDETRARCPGCGKNVEKTRLPSCANWCGSARECLGEDRWRQLRITEVRNVL